MCNCNLSKSSSVKYYMKVSMYLKIYNKVVERLSYMTGQSVKDVDDNPEAGVIAADIKRKLCDSYVEIKDDYVETIYSDILGCTLLFCMSKDNFTKIATDKPCTETSCCNKSECSSVSTKTTETPDKEKERYYNLLGKVFSVVKLFNERLLVGSKDYPFTIDTLIISGYINCNTGEDIKKPIIRVCRGGKPIWVSASPYEDSDKSIGELAGTIIHSYCMVINKGDLV